MKILYVGSDIALSAMHGGAVHVREVASGLATLGHTVRAVVKGLPGEPVRASEPGFEVRRVLQHIAPRMLRLPALPAVALPVVTIDVPALSRMVRPGMEGLLYPQGDAAALAAALGELLGSPDRARSLGVSARRRAVEKFSWRGHCAPPAHLLRDPPLFGRWR